MIQSALTYSSTSFLQRLKEYFEEHAAEKCVGPPVSGIVSQHTLPQFLNTPPGRPFTLPPGLPRSTGHS